MKKFIIILLFFVCLFTWFNAWAKKTITWDDSKLVSITILPSYSETGISFVVQIRAEILDDVDNPMRTVTYTMPWNDMTSSMQNEVWGFIQHATKEFRKTEIDENNHGLPPLE